MSFQTDWESPKTISPIRISGSALTNNLIFIKLTFLFVDNFYVRVTFLSKVILVLLFNIVSYDRLCFDSDIFKLISINIKLINDAQIKANLNT